MSAAWNDIFQLPPAALAGRRVPKAALTRSAELTKLEQRALDRVALLEHLATVQKSTTRIPPHIDAERDIQGVIFLRCELVGASAAYAELGQLLHKCFPNSTVILFEGAGEVCISCAVTRLSLAERGATVVEGIDATGGFSLADVRYAPLLKGLAFDALPQDDLYVYVRELSWRMRLARLVGSLGFYPDCPATERSHLLELSAKLDELTSERNALAEQRRNRDLTLNETAKLRIRQRDVEKQMAATLAEIKRACNG